MCSVFGLFWFQLMMMKGESMHTSIRSLLSRAVRSRVAGVAVALLAALGIVVQGLAAPAAADVNPQIEITNVSLTKVNSANEPQTGPLYVDSLALLKFDWKVLAAQVHEGDSFTIALPPELQFNSNLVRSMKYGGTEVGSCTVDGQTFTCTFGSGITSLMRAGNRDAHGTAGYQLTVMRSTTLEELPFVINGDKTVQVDLPETGGIIVGQSKYNPDKRIYKGYTGSMKEGDTKATWLFHFGGPSLQQALNLTFDGQTKQTITFKDTLGAGMKCPLQSVILYAVDSEENPSQSFELDNGLEPGPKTTDQGAFEVTGKCDEPKADGTTPITFEVKGPFRAKTNYQVSYSTLFTGDDGKALPGTDYTNTVSADGTTITSTNTVSFVAAGFVTLSMRQGEGTFSITKKIASDYANQVAAGVTFEVAFNYELPAGTTKADYPNWTPPANSLNTDQRTGTATMEVTRGQTISFPIPFPTGTVISNLRENTSTADPVLPDGYVWKDPKFTIGSTATTSLTIGDQTTTKVDLLNTVGAADTGRFSVKKTVAGDAGSDAPASYTFDYTCKAEGKDPMTGTIVVGKGETKNSDEIPVGYSCSVKERVDKGQDGTAYLEGYTLDVTTSPDVTIAKGAVSNIGVTNTYTLNKGTFSVKKVVEGATFTGADNSFTVEYTCTHGSVALTDEQKAGSLTLTGNGTAVTSPSLPFGTSCTIKEADGSAQRAGYAVATAYTASPQVTVGTATPSPEVTVTNKYAPLTGGFVISKTVDGDGAALAKDTQFTFDYTCTPLTGAAQVKGTVVVKGGENGAVTDVPVGSCSVSERDATIDGASLNTVLTVDGSSEGVNNGTAVFNVKDGVTVKVAVTNTYVRDRGSFSVAKKVVGGADSFTKDTFVFDYVCTDGTQGRLDVPGDGTAVEGPRVPTGTECTVTERAQTANRDGYTVTSELSDNGKVTISQKDAVVAVTATNTYTPVPKVPSKQLAKTGASNVAVVGVVGSLLVVVGGVLIALRRRRHDA